MKFLAVIALASLFLFPSCAKEEVMTFDDQITIAQDYKVDVATGDTFYRFYMPSAFTPNGDGINDLYIVYGQGWNRDEFEMKIFSREGNMIYYANDVNEGFEGRILGRSNRNAQQLYTVDVVVADTSGEVHHYNYKILQLH